MTETTETPGPAYQPVSSWGPWAALGIAAAIMVVSLLVASLVGGIVSVIAMAVRGELGPEFSTLTPKELMARTLPWMLPAMLLSQVGTVYLTWLVAGQKRSYAPAVLAMVRPIGRPLFWIATVIGFVVVSYLLAYVINAATGSTGEEDANAILPFVNTALWPLALVVIVIGAPLSEEFLFRGFLFSALARSPLGLVGAAVVNSAMWASLHVYSWQGVLTIFGLGLMLSYLLVRSGSIWLPVAAHAAFNFCSFLLMMQALQEAAA